MRIRTSRLPPAADLTAGLGVGVRGDRPVLRTSVRVESRGVRRVADLIPVTGAMPGRTPGTRIQYWTFGGVADAEHHDHLSRLPVSYDLTFIPDRPIGWERAKTHGHVHVRQDNAPGGYPEVYEVLHGKAGFMLQDMQPGPKATFAILVTAREGQQVVIPPVLHHCTVNMAESTLVVANVVCRAAAHDYLPLRTSGGLAYHFSRVGGIVPNPSYRARPALQTYDADAWSGPSSRPLYAALLRQPGSFSWLCDPINAVALPISGSPHLSGNPPAAEGPG